MASSQISELVLSPKAKDSAAQKHIPQTTQTSSLNRNFSSQRRCPEIWIWLSTTATSTINLKTLSAGVSFRNITSRSSIQPSLTVSIRFLPSRIRFELTTQVFCRLTRCLHMACGKNERDRQCISETCTNATQTSLCHSDIPPIPGASQEVYRHLFGGSRANQGDGESHNVPCRATPSRQFNQNHERTRGKRFGYRV